MQSVASEAAEFGVVGVEFGAQGGAAVGVEGEGFAAVAQVLCPAGEVVGGVGQFQYARDNEGEVGFGVAVWGKIHDLLFDVILQMCATDFLSGSKVMY